VSSYLKETIEEIIVLLKATQFSYHHGREDMAKQTRSPHGSQETEKS
jgi:hypothetical protein